MFSSCAARVVAPGSARSTTTPAARRRAMPWPATCTKGSVVATTTRDRPAAISASAQGGVRPWWAQGSKLTQAVPPSTERPACCAQRKAITSAWGPPACWVKPWPAG